MTLFLSPREMVKLLVPAVLPMLRRFPRPFYVTRRSPESLGQPNLTALPFSTKVLPRLCALSSPEPPLQTKSPVLEIMSKVATLLFPRPMIPSASPQYLLKLLPT